MTDNTQCGHCDAPLPEHDRDCITREDHPERFKRHLERIIKAAGDALGIDIDIPQDVVTHIELQQDELSRLREENKRLRAMLSEALDEWSYSAKYKGYLAVKHGDEERIAEIRAALADTEGK